MKYYIDTEFLEGPQKEKFPISLFRRETKPTIDLISIGIVSEEIETETLHTGRDFAITKSKKSREYYAISKDFNLDEAWNRFDLKENGDKVYWIRENVIYPIFWELYQKEWPIELNGEFGNIGNFKGHFERYGNGKKILKELIAKYGKTNKQIAKEIRHFIANRPIDSDKEDWILEYDTKDVEFYAYYADYDWVAFCWLFGKMMDLPNGFPMYCRDLKQILDEKPLKYKIAEGTFEGKYMIGIDPYYEKWEQHVDYPKQENEHSAIHDARWNKKLYDFLNSM